MKQTSDGGYVVVGTANFGTDDVYLVKTDAAGKVDCVRSYDGVSRNDYGKSVQQTTDGGYIILGEYAGSVSRQLWLIKTDENGTKSWAKTYGFDSYDEEAGEVQQTYDGGYILVGTTGGGSNRNVYVVKTDGSGNTQWYKEKGFGDSNETGSSVQQTSDGGYILTGRTNQYDGGYIIDGDIWLVKLDASGNTVWQKNYGEGGIAESGNSVLQTADGGYIIAGDTGSVPNLDFCLLKTDATGNSQWQKSYGGLQANFNAVAGQTTDGGYIIAACTYSYGAGLSDGYLIKTDSTGNKIWSKTFGGSGQDYFYSVQQTRDGGYIMTGSTEIVKTDANGT